MIRVKGKKGKQKEERKEKKELMKKFLFFFSFRVFLNLLLITKILINCEGHENPLINFFSSFKSKRGRKRKEERESYGYVHTLIIRLGLHFLALISQNVIISINRRDLILWLADWLLVLKKWEKNQRERENEKEVREKNWEGKENRKNWKQKEEKELKKDC